MQIDYIALRNIKTGHTVDTAYVINVDVQQLDPLAFHQGNSLTALAGNRVHTTHHTGLEYQIRTTPVAVNGEAPDIDDMREFLNSVLKGEVFQIDGQNAEIANLKSPYTETFNGNLFKEYSFKVRIV